VPTVLSRSLGYIIEKIDIISYVVFRFVGLINYLYIFVVFRQAQRISVFILWKMSILGRQLTRGNCPAVRVYGRPGVYM
jgi:hypothetical protein